MTFDIHRALRKHEWWARRAAEARRENCEMVEDVRDDHRVPQVDLECHLRLCAAIDAELRRVRDEIADAYEARDARPAEMPAS